MKGEIEMEKYGTIPKRFTKDWWAYFWDYYKIHTISAGVAVVMIGTTAYQCATKTKYDLTMSYVGSQAITDEMQLKICNEVSAGIDEITGNEQKDLFLYQYSVGSGDTQNAEYEYAMGMKLAAEMQAGEADIYLASGAGIETLKGYAECFMDVSDFAEGDFSDESVLKDENGRAFAVSLKDNPYLANAGIDSSDMYMAVRFLFQSNEKKEEYVKMHENSLKAASFILGE